jgi:hypothetical protein
MLVFSTSVFAQEKTFADDLPRVSLHDVNQHYRSVYGRSPVVEEWRYWVERMHDKPILMQFIGAMHFHLQQGSNPRIEDARHKFDITGTPRHVFPGEKYTLTVTLRNENTVAIRGVLQVDVNSSQVSNFAPLPSSQEQIAPGVTRLRYSYVIPSGEHQAVRFRVTVPSGISMLNIDARPVGHTVRAVRQAHVLQPFDDDPSSLTFFERQVPFIFIDVFNRAPLPWELQYWRNRLSGVTGLGQLKGAMEFQRSLGRTGNMATVPGPVALVELNSVFRFVYGRSPTISEWHYWALRLNDKPDRIELIGAMTYHRIHGIQH